MTRERATQEAKKFLFDTDLMKPETRALILRDLLISACELEAAAERERCAAICDAKASYAIDKAAGRDKLSGELLAQLAGIMKDTAERIRSLGPASALDEFERKVRLDEAEWWAEYSGKLHPENNRDCEFDCEFCQRLAALRATPQPTAVKENANE